MRLYPNRWSAWAVLCALYLRGHAGFWGLRTPEFIQADDFRTIIYRQEKVTEQPQKVSDPTEKVTEQGQKSNQAEQESNQAEQKSNQVEQEKVTKCV